MASLPVIIKKPGRFNKSENFCGAEKKFYVVMSRG